MDFDKKAEVLPVEGKITLSLNVISMSSSMCFLNKGYAFTPCSVMVNTIYEDDLDWGEKGLVECYLKIVSDYKKYDLLKKEISKSFIFLTEVMLYNNMQSESIGCTTFLEEDHDFDNSLPIDPEATFIQVAVFINLQTEPDKVYFLILPEEEKDMNAPNSYPKEKWTTKLFKRHE